MTCFAICRDLSRMVLGPRLGHRNVVRACTGNINCRLQELRETGATGLEPATSGVTGRAGRDRYGGLRVTVQLPAAPPQTGR